ncbi:hypothetical protein PIROE2DRAFT_14344 [Piromyces sp. E2]|nr:hypothetical protein PIROE2DRAFT_14344 [Piromyces sp. E2]|eukprot:OUM60007.1 hypothetical protein PIROE2DRAFT_14344 [Piromyces sp. E2]
MNPSKPSIDRVINEKVVLNGSWYMNLLHLIYDDGNTPFHLLCKRIDSLSLDYNHFLYRNYYFPYYDPKNYLNSEYIKYFTSVPSSTSAIELLNFFSYYVDFSIRNKYYKRIDELVNNNIIFNNIYYMQMVKKSKNKFPSKRPNRPTDKCNYKYIEDWNALFKFQCPKRKSRTLLHFLMMGDRLEAIKFLVDLGADINYRIPSGFMYPLSYKTGRIDDNKFLLRKDEKIILEETEKIVEFFMNNGCDLSLCGEPPHCDISDILFKEYMKRNKENKKAKPTRIHNIFTVAKKNISKILMNIPCLPIGDRYKNKYFMSNNDRKYIRVETFDSQEETIDCQEVTIDSQEVTINCQEITTNSQETNVELYDEQEEIVNREKTLQHKCYY